MTIIIDTGDRVIPMLTQIVSLLQQQGKIMAAIDDQLARLTQDSANMANRVNTDLANLNGQIDTLKQQVQSLQDQLANANLSPDQQAAFDAVDNTINTLDVPQPVPVPPTPAP